MDSLEEKKRYAKNLVTGKRGTPDPNYTALEIDKDQSHRPWIALFSQSGSEIAFISNQMTLIEDRNRWPDAIITNKPKRKLLSVDPELLSELQPDDFKTNPGIKKVPNLLFMDSSNPSEEELEAIFSQYDNPIITLHGWLRIIPPALCDKYEIYNGHPAWLFRYPELKGKDPQKRAWDGNYHWGGQVIHKVTKELDEGEIVFHGGFVMSDWETYEEYMAFLKWDMRHLWRHFFMNIGFLIRECHDETISQAEYTSRVERKSKDIKDNKTEEYKQLTDKRP